MNALVQRVSTCVSLDPHSNVAKLPHVSKLYARKAWLPSCAVETKSSPQLHRC